MEVCSVKAIWIVQACVDVRGQVVDMFTGAYASLEGARASLERLARAKGKTLDVLGGKVADISFCRIAISNILAHRGQHGPSGLAYHGPPART